MLNFLLSFFRKKRPSPPPINNLSWSEILPGENNIKEIRIMLLPTDKAIVWKTENEKKKCNDGISLLFEFQYAGKRIPITMKRHFDQKVLDSMQKLRSIVIKKLAKDLSEKECQEIGTKFKMALNIEVSDKCTMREFYENKDAIELSFLNRKYEIVRKNPPSYDFGLTMTPLTNSIVIAKFASSELSPKYHWFVSNKKYREFWKRKNAKNDIEFKFLNEEKRTFHIEGYEYRSSGRFYEADPKDVDKLVAVVFDSGNDLPVHCSISTQVVEIGPIELITDSQIEWCKNNKRIDHGIRVMTYNILADLYLKLNVDQKDLFFKYCDKNYQRALYRVPLIMRQFKEFLQSGVELFFIQEVDCSKVHKYYIPFFQYFNYHFVFAKKQFLVNEGVGIAFDDSRFRLIKSMEYGLHQLVNEKENEDVLRTLDTSESSKKILTTRPTVVQIVILEDLKVADKWIICANTHLHHNPKDEHIKLLQSVMATRIIAKVKNDIKNDPNSPKNIHVLFGGDFNSIPSGPVFEFMSTGKISADHVCWELDPAIEGTSFEFPENLKLTCLTGTPEYTNYTHTNKTPGFIGCLDYVWGEDISCDSMCPMPEHSKVRQYGAIPSKISPSDHLPLISDLKYG
ncbi:unnamed protein product [Caenorhabditis angaria]|uniref:Endonuclease/exonuclease/phosphatase domain-containing protein n=1 Tax=Caenorhabditis angaria TaxID=860376 RepID=A0A9P1N0W4_9PELO|nr:unnamed protein product [Caenorhabditis angaria]